MCAGACEFTVSLFTNVDTQPEEEAIHKKAAEEEKKKTKLKELFKDCRFFLSREVPREALTFIIRCFGGVVSWDESVAGSTYPETNMDITHQVVDRPTQSHRYLSRYVYEYMCIVYSYTLLIFIASVFILNWFTSKWI